MKIIISLVLCSVLELFVGCKSLPTADKMYDKSYLVGVSTGMVLNMIKIPDDNRHIIVKIVNEVSYYIPETNQTFTSTWSPIINNYVSKLVSEGKLDNKYSNIIIKSSNIICKGIDHLFDHKYPEAGLHKELLESGTHGFISGFLTVYKFSDTLSSSRFMYDSDTFNYLMNNK